MLRAVVPGGTVDLMTSTGRRFARQKFQRFVDRALQIGNVRRAAAALRRADAVKNHVRVRDGFRQVVADEKLFAGQRVKLLRQIRLVKQQLPGAQALGDAFGGVKAADDKPLRAKPSAVVRPTKPRPITATRDFVARAIKISESVQHPARRKSKAESSVWCAPW